MGEVNDDEGIKQKIKKYLKAQVKTPFFWVAVVWLLIVVLSGALLTLVLINKFWKLAKASNHTSDIWIEVNSQILNGCFSLAAFYNQPYRILYLFLLLFRSKDSLHPTILKLFPWATLTNNYRQLLLVVIILNLNCIFQYPISAMMWGFHYSERPSWVIPVFLPLSFGCAIAGGVLPLVFQRRSKRHQSEGEEMASEPGPDDDTMATPPLLRKY